MTGSSIQLEIGIDYLNRESTRGSRIEDWIAAYCKRNHIPLARKLNREERKFHVEQYGVLALYFKSQWQYDCFIRQGNKAFPYFEFH